MAVIFIVEDGTGIVDANSYVEVSFVNQYAENYCPEKLSDWNALTEEEKQSAIIQGSIYIDKNFTFKGHVKSCVQGLLFPRVCLYDPCGNEIADVVPDANYGSVKKATAEYALRAAFEKLNPDPPQDLTGRVTMIKGCCSTVSYSDLYGAVTTKKYPSADKFLKYFITNNRNKSIRG
jgi:hypothetical protein